MYKTVRHGDNSLQYTIVPQQDDGAAVAERPPGRRHRKKGKTAAVVAVTIVLICGVIATAVLVPLLLTSDLVAIPAAFQEFSVARFRTVRVGSHKEVLAEKPPGWHVNPTTTTSTTKTSTSTTSTSTSTSTTTTTTTAAPTTTTSSTTTTTTTVRPPTTIMQALRTVAETSATPKVNPPPTPTTGPMSHILPIDKEDAVEAKWSPMMPSTPADIDLPQRNTKPPGTWYNSIRWPMFKDKDDIMYTVLDWATFVLSIVFIIGSIWLVRSRRLNRNRSIMERATEGSQTADKENLLTKQAGASDEEA